MIYKSILSLLFCMCFLSFGLSAQSENEQVARKFIEQRAAQLSLSPSDVSELSISSAYFDDDLQTEHFYFQQQVHGIDIYNAIFNVHVKNGKVVHSGNRLVDNVLAKAVASQASIGAEFALQTCFRDLNFESRSIPQVRAVVSEKQVIFEKGEVAHSDIQAKLIYQTNANNNLDLVWEIMFDAVDSDDYWRYSIDALTGKVIDKKSITIHCQFPSHHHDGCDDPVAPVTKVESMLPPNGDGAKYQAFKFPLESPIHGTRSIIIDPADPVASPYGWHDTTGVAGAEFTITRGNNVHAYLDTNGDNRSDGGEPNGGATLEFLAPFTYTAEPDSINRAAVINLFYVNNFMHDFAYTHGFTEKAGNFQQNNYGKGGQGNDYVFAEAQDNSKASTPSLNNANFSTPSDGQGGRMQMFLWNSTSSKVFSVSSPENIKGFYECSPAGWGKPIDNVPLNLDLVIAYDNSNTLCCGTIVTDVKDKMAIIDRGTCQFGEKALNAQKAGAKAVCICNFEEALLTMGAGTSGALVTIPVIMLKKQSCDRIKEQLLAGKKASGTLVLPADVSGPKLIDGDFDNGIIAHEYGHGISNRLTGGPANAGCLGNQEQMGEGWSDFFSLATTAIKGRDGSEPLGIGTFALRQEVTGGGIRAFPYSTDMKINPNVYDDIIGAEVHRLGEVWTSCTWDLYWEMVKLYGFDEDLVNGQGGNNKAVRLVMEGMKLQPCSPGFVDGRDAIIAADKLLYNGIHECLIWKVFARRGLGYLASQGSSNSTTDGKMNFEVLPACIKEIKIVKAATPLIDGGQEIAYSLKVTNDKGVEATEVIVTDEFPTNATYVNGSASVPATVTGNMISFNLGKMANGAVRDLTYKVVSDKRKSVRSFFDDMENGEGNWDYASLNDSLGVWEVQQTEKKSGNNAWKVPNLTTAQDQVLQFFPDVKVVGTRPAMRFWHLYNTESGNDGGFLQISTDGGTKWEDLGPKIFRNTYRGKMNYTTFATPNVSAYWGNSNGWIETFVDLTAYAGKTVKIRFRFGSNNGVGGNGWYVDDVELFDMINYNTEACVTTAEGDKSCAIAAGYGTVVNTGINVSNDDQLSAGRIAIFPNPSSDLINISLLGDRPSNLLLELLTIDGKVILTKQLNQPTNLIPLDVSSLTPGIYYLRSILDGKRLVTKVAKF